MIWDDNQNKCIGELMFKNEGNVFRYFFYIWIFIESFIFTSNLYEESQNDLAPFILDFHGFIENDSFFIMSFLSFISLHKIPKKI